MSTDDNTTDIFTAVESMCTDTVASSIDDGADVNVINAVGCTPLTVALQKLHFYRTSFVKPNTATFYSFSLADIVRMLIPLVHDINCSYGLQAGESPLSLCIRCDVLTFRYTDMSCTADMVRHGAMLDVVEIISKAIHHRELQLRFMKDEHSGFFTAKFLSFMRCAGLNFGGMAQLQQSMLSTVSDKYKHFMEGVKVLLCYPLRLQELCVMQIRRSLCATRGRLWSKGTCSPFQEQ